MDATQCVALLWRCRCHGVVAVLALAAPTSRPIAAGTGAASNAPVAQPRPLGRPPLLRTACSATHRCAPACPPAPLPQTWGNLADALVQRAELLGAAGGPPERQQGFSQALQAYERSCALTDSSNGGALCRHPACASELPASSALGLPPAAATLGGWAHSGGGNPCR
jgi:hypothetical protein